MDPREALANMTEQRNDAAREFAALYDALAEIPTDSRSSYVDRLLARHDRFRGDVDRWLADEDS